MNKSIYQRSDIPPDLIGYFEPANDKALEIGSEPSPDCGTMGKANCGQCFVCKMVEVFTTVHRVLRDDGTLWLNLGDTYTGSSNTGGTGSSTIGNSKGQLSNKGSFQSTKRPKTSIPAGNLVGIPWRVALALQANGWILRQDIVWCLSGGAWVYSRTQKGDMPVMLKDLVRLDPSTVKLWNGQKWTQVLGWGKSNTHRGRRLEIVLRSGERIGCTRDHVWPTQRGNVKANELLIGDIIQTCDLPEPDGTEMPGFLTSDVLWFLGLYLAEGSRHYKSGTADSLSLALHSDETEWVDRIRRAAEHLGGTVTYGSSSDNGITVRVYGRVVVAAVEQFIAGKTAKDKHFSNAVWALPNVALQTMMEGYLNGDGHEDKKNNRWRLGFTRNYDLARDLRTLAARLGASISLRASTSTNTATGKKHPSFRGEWRWFVSGYRTEKSRSEVVSIGKSRARCFWDVAVEDKPHLFALASGVLTHNCKPSPMPESVTNRCTKAHEYIFLLTKKKQYYYDADAIKEAGVSKPIPEDHKMRSGWKIGTEGGMATGRIEDDGGKFFGCPTDGRNKRSVWTIASEAVSGSHFATFPQKLVKPCILAGTSEFGCCSDCAAPFRRVTEREKLKRERPNDYVKRTGEEGTGNSCANTVAGVSVSTVGWEPGCDCYGVDPRPIFPPRDKVGEGSPVIGRENAHNGPRIAPNAEDGVLATSGKGRSRAKKSFSGGNGDNGPEVVPCVVLDPFAGSGTSMIVAQKLVRRSIGIELSEKYLKNNAIPRIEGTLLSLGQVHLIPGKQPVKVEGVGRSLRS